jgi:hypothetical protein|tara:strand:+ start:1392 stop:2219 length:828 start_codon:yes stop_codon:yes gene_type:complete
MSKNLIEIQKKILHLVNEGSQVDKVIDKTTSELNTTEKIELKLLFEDAMRTHRMNAENWMQTDLIFPLSEILKSRLFVYPESSEQYYGYEPSPLELKIQNWKELENEEGALYALIYNDIEKRNKAIYDLADKVARNNQCNIDLGIFISELDKHITRYTSEIDILSGLHLRYSIPQKNILVWDTLTCAENLGGTNSQTFGRYKISCKFQWELLNRTPEPEVGYLQIEENDDVKNLGDSFHPIFVEMVENFYDLDNKLDLLYNKLNDIRQTNDRVAD